VDRAVHLADVSFADVIGESPPIPFQGVATENTEFPTRLVRAVKYVLNRSSLRAQRNEHRRMLRGLCALLLSLWDVAHGLARHSTPTAV
jgi:hypothetical protein